jgi:glutamyl-tRNA reductase
MLASSHASLAAAPARRGARRSLRARALSGGEKPKEAAAPASAVASDKPTVFVAGATGRTGQRCVRELVAAGYKVRAGARDANKAQALFADQPAGSVTAVAADVTKADTLRASIGDARVVISAIGAPESEVRPVATSARQGHTTDAVVAA